MEKVIRNFSSMPLKVNDRLLLKYTCHFCHKPLQICFRSILYSNVVVDCQGILRRKAVRRRL
jgi:hypothetical protein